MKRLYRLLAVRRPAVLGVVVAAGVASVCCGAGIAAGSAGAAHMAAKTTVNGGKPIKIMVETFVGQPEGSFPGVWGAAKAAALAIRKAGGPNIKVLTCDSMLTPDGAVACARQAIQQKVVAYMGNADFTTETLPLLKKAGIPPIIWGDSVQAYQTLQDFPINGGNFPFIIGQADAAKAAGAKKLAIVAIDVPVAVQGAALIKQEAQKIGLRVVADIVHPATETTWDTLVTQLRGTNADAVALLEGAPQVLGILQAAQSVGYNPIWAPSNSLDTVSQQEAAKLSGRIWLTSAFPTVTDTSFSAIRTYNKQMNAAGKAGIANTSSADRAQQATENTWFSVQGVAQILERITGKVTAASLLKQLRATKTPVDIEGLIHWTPGVNGPAPWKRVTDGGVIYYGPLPSTGIFNPTKHIAVLKTGR